jgi:hypothetical protein
VRDYLVTRLNKSAQDFIEKPTPTPGGPTATPGEDETTDEEAFDEEPLD